MKQYGDRYPGKHVDDFALEVLEELEAPKVEWIAGVADLLAGRGSHMTYSTDYPGKLFYVDPRDMSLPPRGLCGLTPPAQSDSSVLLLVDTSRSVDRQLLRRFFSEGLGVLQRQCGHFHGVRVLRRHRRARQAHSRHARQHCRFPQADRGPRPRWNRLRRAHPGGLDAP